MTGQAGPAALLAAHPGRVVCEGMGGGHLAAALPAHQAAQVPAQLQGVAAARTLAVEIPGTFSNKLFSNECQDGKPDVVVTMCGGSGSGATRSPAAGSCTRSGSGHPRRSGPWLQHPTLTMQF